MLKLKKMMYITISCLLLCIAWANPLSANETRDRTEVLQEIDEYMNRSMKANHIKAASLAIANNDEVFYAKGYGTFADGQKVTGNTPFPLLHLASPLLHWPFCSWWTRGGSTWMLLTLPIFQSFLHRIPAFLTSRSVIY